MLQRSTIQLLRFPFSFFLMPVYWFALSTTTSLNVPKAIAVFVILHLMVYPSSNGYNSYMDRDEGPIGGLANPLQPTQQLYRVTLLLDIAAVLASLFVSPLFAIGVLIYIIFSRLYSYRPIRLKKYPIIGYCTVVLNQGALTFWMVYVATQANVLARFPTVACVAAAFLIGGFYPITQVYQHKQDKKDGVITLSSLLGVKGTFIWCAAMYVVAFGLLFVHFQRAEQISRFFLLQALFLPVLFYFFSWAIRVWRNEREADFASTMRMNWVASIVTNSAFIIITILNHIG